MSPRIFIFSCEPGGAEALSPIVRLLSFAGRFAVTVAAYGSGYQRFRNNGIRCTRIDPIGPDSTRILDRFRPDLVITSATSLPEKDMSEKYLWTQASRRGIKSLAFVDQWQNYAIRFSGPRPGERLAYLPDRINCLDKIGLRDMIAEGFPKARLVPLGHPYLSNLKKSAMKLDPEKIRHKVGLPHGRRFILFVSEPIEENYGLARGYTQYSALQFFIRHLWPLENKGQLFIKLHDKDQARRYQQFARSKSNDISLLPRELTPIEALVAAHKVYGMTSLMLIQAFILGKKTISVQPGLNIKDPLILSRTGAIQIIRSLRDIGTPWRRNKSAKLDIKFKKEEFMRVVSELLPPRMHRAPQD